MMVDHVDLRDAGGRNYWPYEGVKRDELRHGEDVYILVVLSCLFVAEIILEQQCK